MNYQRSYRIPPLGEFRVMTLRECAPSQPQCSSAEQAAEYWRANIMTNLQFSWETQEVFAVIFLSPKRHIIGHNITSCGTLDTLLVHPREVFRPAIVAAAAAVILGHNHPSGDPTPSELDIKVTRDMIQAGKLLRIEVLDHVIIGRATANRPKYWCSLRELGFFHS